MFDPILTSDPVAVVAFMVVCPVLLAGLLWAGVNQSQGQASSLWSPAPLFVVTTMMVAIALFMGVGYALLGFGGIGFGNLMAHRAWARRHELGD